MRDPYSLEEPFRAARQTIDASVVVGGDLLDDEPARDALFLAGRRGVRIRLLFPLPKSRWLKSFAADARIDLFEYARKIVRSSQRATALAGVELRWYETPGPCWFVIVDDTWLYTKPISATRPTLPVLENRRQVVEHFGDLFSQLWQSSLESFRSERPSTRPLVQLVASPSSVIERLMSDPEAMHALSPDAFEIVIADRLSAMRLGVRRVGTATRKDGGVDLIAWPEANAAFPFLLAVQVKHSRVGASVGPETVRDLRGVLGSQPIDVGLIATNTRFTPDAEWAAKDGHRIIRLRDFDDICRWIRSDFALEGCWELPKQILLAPGVRVDLPA
jgi:hypothetical protein